VGAGLGLGPVDLAAVEGDAGHNKGRRGQIDGDAERSLAVGGRRALGKWARKAALILRLRSSRQKEVGVEGVGVGLLAGDADQATAGLGDRRDPRRGGEQDRQEDRGGDFAGRFEIQVRLAELDREPVNLGRVSVGVVDLRIVASVMKEQGTSHYRRSA